LKPRLNGNNKAREQQLTCRASAMQYKSNGGAPPPARMAYSAGGASARQEAAARTELFTGAGQPAAMQVQQPMSYDDMNNKQLMQHAVETHKETTASAKRGLQVCCQA
jgi:hypothetical protein